MLIDTVKSAVLIGREVAKQGKVADYIPELSKADKNHLGLCVYTCDGQMVESGDTEQRFTIQSVCKVVNLAVALQAFGFDEVFSHVKMEPSGDAFDSVIKLDLASNRPYNPLINAGAIAVVSLLQTRFSFDEMLGLTKDLCMDNDIRLNEVVYHSEFETGNRNRAIGYLLASKGVLPRDDIDFVNQSVDLYFHLCSMEVNARSLAGLGMILANGGINPVTGDRLLDTSVVRIVKTLMFTCGLYEGSGEWAVRAGIPAKSGVGGGIIGCVDRRMGIGSFGPALDVHGNSIGGIAAIEHLAGDLQLHVF